MRSAAVLGTVTAALYLGEDKTFVRVLDDGCHAIAVQREEGRLLQLGSGVDLGRVGHVELLKKQGDFPRVRSS